jgi:hypothetical protein
VLRAAHLGQPDVVTAAYAASVRALIAVLSTLNEQVATLQGQMETYFGQHPDAEILTSQPGLGSVLGALMTQAFAALTGSPGARAYYDHQRARGSEHNPALRQLANRLVGIQHGCLKTRTLYNEATAWPNHATKPETAAA